MRINITVSKLVFLPTYVFLKSRHHTQWEALALSIYFQSEYYAAGLTSYLVVSLEAVRA
jgi:hypothetical protein